MLRFLCLLSAIAMAGNGYGQRVYYVSGSGNDASPGTPTHPLKTLRAALGKVAETRSARVRIELRGGRYAIDRTLEVTPDVLAGHALEIRAYAGEKVTLLGAERLSTHWAVWKGPILHSFVGAGLTIDQLFCNGKALPMARYPNFDATQPVYNGTAEDAISPSRVKRWQNPTGGYVHAIQQYQWGSLDYRITGKDSAGRLTMEGGWQMSRPAPMHARYRYVENIFEELDAPGEWYYDSTSGQLYCYPPKGVYPATAVFERSTLNDILVLRGDDHTPVKDVTVSHIRFSETNRTFMLTRETLVRSDWTIYRGGALVLEGTERCKIEGCTLEQLGGNAIMVSDYNRRDTIRACHIAHIGASGICFVGDTAAARSAAFRYEDYVPYTALDLTPGPKTPSYPSQCLAEDNLMHNLGETEKQSAGVEIDLSAGIVVRHNTIYHVPRAGINIGDGCWGGHVIEYNDVFNTVLETGDHGAFNSWGRDRFWSADRGYMDSLVAVHPGLILLDAQTPDTLRYNRFRCDHGWDIDLDDGSSNYRIYGNVCLNGGIKFREGFYRVGKNNVLVNNAFHPHVWFRNSGDVFEHNIVMKPYFPIQINYWGTEVDYNLFPDTAALNAARRRGTDAHSLSGDPLFVDPAAGDYRVKPGSPALTVGFANFPMDRFGVRDSVLRRMAGKPAIPVLAKPAGAVTATPIDWLGGRIKSVEGLGDRSAYGLPDEHGVIVLQAPSRSGLKAGDVIRSLNNRAVDDAAGLQKLYISNRSGAVTLSIIRNQQTLDVRLH
jgi:hypothetical protein